MNAQLILKQFPSHILFRILHYSLITLQLRDELEGGAPFGKRGTLAPRSSLEWQPLSLWLANILMTYSGDILGNLFLGTLPLEPLCNAHDVLFCSFIWYIIFFCPLDLGHAVARTVTFRVLAATMTAISQVVIIEKGVQLAGSVYGNASIPMLVAGTIMGSGAELLRPVASLLINKCQGNNHAYVKLSTNSKLALMISWLYVLETNHNHLILGLTRHQLQGYLLILLITFKYLSLAYRTDHLIWLIESRICYTFFGGLYSDLSKFFNRQTASPGDEIRRRRWAFKKFD
ncbi:trimeric intracellular cation channel type 1B.1 [Drosophila willistoni]|uniref:trimeric intracellular cation channel type 1B.1 n=1 Tax=Drosophila willistoni TaxID=7260 RepID=UPI000C26D818|nr:trimeric intracellular cation channel type 1B.1 [Drosophila willistoni]